MKYRVIISILFLSSFTLLMSCKSTNDSTTSDNEKKGTMAKTKSGPPVIIYKTTGKYYNKVPVGLSEDKTRVVNYPDPKDVFRKGTFSYPTMLENGYFLDNRGIDENSAFLELTYEEYSKLEKAPSAEELYNDILDNDPFTEMYHCGSRFDYKDLEKELNDLIAEGNLNSMKKLK